MQLRTAYVSIAFGTMAVLSAPSILPAQTFYNNGNNDNTQQNIARRQAVTAAQGEVDRAQKLLEAATAKVKANFAAAPDQANITKDLEAKQAAFEQARKVIVDRLRSDPAYQDAAAKAKQADSVVREEQVANPISSAAPASPSSSSNETSTASAAGNAGNIGGAGAAGASGAAGVSNGSTGVSPDSAVGSKVSPSALPAGYSASPAAASNVPTPSDTQVRAGVEKLEQKSALTEMEQKAIAADPAASQAKADLDAARDKSKLQDAQLKAALLNDADYKAAFDQLQSAKSRLTAASGQ